MSTHPLVLGQGGAGTSIAGTTSGFLEVVRGTQACRQQPPVDRRCHRQGSPTPTIWFQGLPRLFKLA